MSSPAPESGPVAERRVRIPLRALLRAIALAAAIALLVAPAPRAAFADLWDPRAVADSAALDRQEAAAFAAVERGHAAAIGTLQRVRTLRLPIGQAEADRIHAAALEELGAIRRSALVSVAAALPGRGGDLEARARAAAGLASQGVLLAPSLFETVRRASEAFAQVADRATRELTAAPSPSPSPTAP